MFYAVVVIGGDGKEVCSVRRHLYYMYYFSEKIKLDISYESSA